jgi:hypothetical protein
MKLSLIACASVVALAAFTMTGNGAVAAEKHNPNPGEGCDLRITPGCKPGTKVQPQTKFPTAPESRHDSNQSGRGPQQHNPPPPPKSQ